jgi:hypothetical protein
MGLDEAHVELPAGPHRIVAVLSREATAIDVYAD